MVKIVYKRRKSKVAVKRTIPSHKRNGKIIPSYKRKMRKDLRKQRTIKRKK